MNRYSITRPYYDVELSSSLGSDFKLGKGADMSNPNDPRFTPPLRPFRLDAQRVGILAEEVVPEEDIQNAIFNQVECTTDEQEAMMLNVYFKASFGLTSFSAALDVARSSRSTSRTLYTVMSNVGEGSSIHVDELVWVAAPDSEQVEDEGDRLRTFVEAYGSHYIANLIYGFKIALRGSISTNDAEQRTGFKLAFEAWGTTTQIDASAQRILRSGNVSLRAEITCGSIRPAQSYILRGYDDISAFLSGLKSGVITITKCPIRAKMNSFFSTMTAFPRTQALLRESAAAALIAPYGVPRGTIISWVPDPADVAAAADGTPLVHPPSGWALCDGRTPGVPNLAERFLRGESQYLRVSEIGGEADHCHDFSGTTTDCRRDPDGWNADDMRRDRGPQSSGLDHSHRFSGTTLRSPSLPPFFGVFFIMKL